jgi:hypothetical protein
VSTAASFFAMQLRLMKIDAAPGGSRGGQFEHEGHERIHRRQRGQRLAARARL